MSVEQMAGQSPLPAFDLDRPIEAVRVGDASSQALGGQLPGVVIASGGSTDTVEALLLSVARGNQEAFVKLQCPLPVSCVSTSAESCANALRSVTVTQETFAEVHEDAIHFDPHRDSAQTWLLTCTPASDGRASLRRRHGRPIHCRVGQSVSVSLP